MRRALVCGAGGFIGHHLSKLLREEGYWVRGVDLKRPPGARAPTDEFLVLDLRRAEDCLRAVTVDGSAVHEVYQLAAWRGDPGRRAARAAEALGDSVLINTHLLKAVVEMSAERFFLASSADVYPPQPSGDSVLREGGAYPAHPRSEHGWEKLICERLALAVSHFDGLRVRVARFDNCYGPGASWSGDCETAPSALCRQVAQAPDDGELDIWCDGNALRDYIYIADLCAGIRALMRSDLQEPVNIGTGRLVSLHELVQTIADLAGKRIRIRCVDGPAGVGCYRPSADLIRSTGWRPVYSLEDGLCRTYASVAEELTVRRSGASVAFGGRGASMSASGRPRPRGRSE